MQKNLVCYSEPEAVHPAAWLRGFDADDAAMQKKQLKTRDWRDAAVQSGDFLNGRTSVEPSVGSSAGDMFLERIISMHVSRVQERGDGRRLMPKPFELGLFLGGQNQLLGARTLRNGARKPFEKPAFS